MKEILQGFFAGLDEVWRWKTTVTLITFAFVSTAFWALIGLIFWPELVALSDKMVDWLPFAMLRSDGAWMLSTFIWLQAVMLTIAVLSLLLTVSVYRELPREHYSNAAMIPILASTGLWTVIWMFKGEQIYHAVLGWLNTLPFDTVENGVSALLVLYMLYNAVIITMVFLTSLYSPVLLRRVRERHFPFESMHPEAQMRSIGYTIRDTFYFLVASFLLLPVLFIPVLNFFVQLLLWIWLVKDTFTYDVGALFYSESEITRIKKRNGYLWTIAAITALFNFFPLVNFAGPFVGEVMMFYYLVGLKGKQR
jgi:hypothetical protein